MSDTISAPGALARPGASASIYKTAAMLRGKWRDEPDAPANEAPPAPKQPDPSVVSANTQMTGAIVTTDELHIHGRIDGDVRAAKLTICAGGIVKGDVIAESIIIHGTIEGRVQGGHVRICAGAKVKGEVTHFTLGIEPNAGFEGSVKQVSELQE